MKRTLAACLPPAAVLLILAGCSDNASQSLAEQTEEAKKPAQADARRLEEGRSWDIYLLQGKRMGYGRTTVSRVVEDGRELVRTENLNRLKIRRGGEVVEQVISGSSLQRPDGELIRYESEMKMGPGAMRAVGRVRGDRLEIEVRGPGETAPNRFSIPWSSDYRGPFASEQTLLRRPMKPGERRKLKTLELGFNQLCTLRLTAKDFESVELLDGRRRLLRIEYLTRFPDGQTIKGTVWCDPSGVAWKTYTEAMDMEIYRVSKAEALREIDAAALDLLPGMMVEVDRPLSDPHRTRRVRYRIHLDRGDPADFFPAGPTQSVKSIDPHTAEVTVHAVRPGVEGNTDAEADKPTVDDRRANNYIQSDDPLIRAQARQAAGDEENTWAAAVALERFVGREVKEKNFSQAFATAAEVAKSGEGDCTEHAVYLAALARARGIPARVAFGLVYIEGRRAFGYHAWTEVYIKDRWTPIDGTLALGGVGAAHLKIADGNLNAASAMNSLLPVIRLIGKLRIEIVDARQ